MAFTSADRAALRSRLDGLIADARTSAKNGAGFHDIFGRLFAQTHAVIDALEVEGNPEPQPEIEEPVSQPQPDGSVDLDPAHNNEDPNDLDPAHHAPGWKPPASTPIVPLPSAPSDSPANENTDDLAGRFGKNTWLGDWSGDVANAVHAEVTKSTDDVSVLIEYNVPGRDAGNYSAGGLKDLAEYDAWTTAVARGIGDEPAWVIVEPDAIGLNIPNWPALLQTAIDNYETCENTRVYVDLSMWLSVDDAVTRIKKLTGMHGFSLNVSGWNTREECIAFGDAIARRTGLHYIVDTSRNGFGNPHKPAWCNVTDTKVGIAPTTKTASEYCDAYLWLKVPGESDGRKINGYDGDGKAEAAPPAGTYWPEYADAIKSGEWGSFHDKYGTRR